VVVDDLDVVGITVLPDEADAVLIIDPYAVLPGSVSDELFEPICRWNPKVSEGHSGIEHPEFPDRDLCHGLEASGRFAPPERGGLSVPKADDHTPFYSDMRYASSVKR